uniref:Uncharacterized protein n=1 Tax=Romanomermis culicivorax TaxID=13658 RepID=A0A915J646_ROMCU
MDHPLVLPYCNVGELTAETILSQIEQLEQSNNDMTFDGDMMVKFTHIISLKGAVYYKKNMGIFKEKLKRNRCIVKIKNSDNLCCARALAVACAYVDNDPHLNTIRKPRNTPNTMQKRLATQLMVMAGLGDLATGCGYSELEKLQTALSPDYQIKVWCKEDFNDLFYEGPAADKILNLYLHE